MDRERRLTRKQTTSRPDSLWPEMWKDMSEAPKRKEKQKWAIEEPKLGNVKQLRGIHFIDSADEGFKEIMKNARRKLEVPTPAAMFCKTRGRKNSLIGMSRYLDTCIETRMAQIMVQHGSRSS